ncbi:TonB-dependent receptor [Methylobacterium sp. E-016]|uniref:TonB-dependent siderophore receptor n=1 Tax=Methylobacterium sp. E-016 TaxID=2836556 RepID=UPI001FB8AA02|nr:TonB-dependent receptor [Methylobacterium sp. E-016]MCJ2074997.1 TonB-dependent receptor [Methylobacterium sp. E-016]
MAANTFGTVGRRVRGAVSAGALALALAGGCRPAQAQTVYAFDVPRGDLAEVVTRIARTAGRPIVFPAALARGRMAGPISGRESVEAALGQALAGTGLLVAPGAGGSLTIRAASGPVAGVPAGADLAAIDVTDAGGIPGGSHGDQGFQPGDAGETIRIGDAPAREIPISVSTVTQKVLESQVITTATDAVQNIAGVNLTPASNGIGRPTFTIRGFSGAGYTVNGMTNGTADQVPIDAVERVEVLKGPTSILNGTSNEGGLVNVALKQPTSETIRNLTVRYGSYNYKTIAADLGGRVEGLEGTTYRFVTSGNHADQNYAGYKDPHEILVAPTIRWQGQDLMVEAGLRYTQTRVAPTTFAFIPTLASGALGPIVRLPRGLPIGNDYFGGINDSLVLSTKQSYDVGRIFGMDVTLNNTFEWSDLRSSYHVPNVDPLGRIRSLADPFPFERTGVDVKVVSPNDRFDVTMKYENEFAKQMLKFGYDYLNARTSQSPYNAPFSASLATGLPEFPRRTLNDSPVYTGKLTATTQGLYVLDKVDTLDNRLHILGSVRHDTQDTLNTVSIPRFNYARTRAASSSGLSWVAGAAFDVTPWMTVYGNRSNGFVPTSAIDSSGNVLPPEQRDLAEVGARYALFDKRLNLTTSFYDLVRSNVSITDPADPSGLTSILVGGQNSKGMEIEAQGEVLPGLNIIASLTSQTFENGQDAGAYDLYGRPKHLASLWGTYTLQDGPLAGLTFGGGVRYVGTFLITPDRATAYRINGYDTFDAAISYEQPDYTVSLKLNNITNKYAFVPSVNTSYLAPIQGRNVTLQATYRF